MKSSKSGRKSRSPARSGRANSTHNGNSAHNTNGSSNHNSSYKRANHSQASRKKNHAPRSDTPHKHLLTILWQDWIYQVKHIKSAQNNWPAYDRWLKKWFSTQDTLPLTLQSELSHASFDIFRKLQTICFLESAYQVGEIAEDILNWDESFQYTDIKSVDPEYVSAWIAILSPDYSFSEQLSCQDRLTWFNAEFQDQRKLHASKNLIELIIKGIRPSWQALITQRQLMSEWSDEQVNLFIEYQNTTPPLWLRSKPEHNEQLKTTLYKQGVQLKLNENGLMALGGKGVNQTEEYKKGIIEIQDLASQQIAQKVQAKSGQKVWDACAGAGGKSLAIAEQMGSKGSVVATDLHDYKLLELKKRAKKAQLHQIRTFVWDGEAPLKLPNDVARQKGFDWVLVDAPCTSAGTWRRNPDAKWRFNQADTDELVKIQQQLLMHASEAVRVGGHLVYATCSWQVAENEAQVADFLAKNTAFKLVEQSLLGAPNVNSDTMFAAVLKRV